MFNDGKQNKLVRKYSRNREHSTVVWRGNIIGTEYDSPEISHIQINGKSVMFSRVFPFYKYLISGKYEKKIHTFGGTCGVRGIISIPPHHQAFRQPGNTTSGHTTAQCENSHSFHPYALRTQNSGRSCGGWCLEAACVSREICVWCNK